MKTHLDCVPCFIRQALEAVRMVTDDEAAQGEIIRRALKKLASEMDMSRPPPVLGQRIHRLIRELTGSRDPYREVKKRFNQYALELYPEMKRRIESFPDALEAGVRIAVAGNIIDFGVNADLNDAQVLQAIDDALTQSIGPASVNEFRTAVVEARDIMYVGDNAGEIVFDRLLIEQMPYERVTFIVRGEPVINDVTLEDAKATGMTELVNVIDNGSDAPGTLLESCSREFRDRLDAADLVIAKGQGNYETLSEIEKETFFLLRAKCPVIARDIGCEVGGLVFLRQSAAESA